MRIITISLFLLISISLISQERRGPGKKGMHGNEPTGEIYGQVLDSLTNQPIPYVTVSLLNAKDGKIVNGLITGGNGKFAIEKVPMGIYNVKLDFVGYLSKIVGPYRVNEEKLIHSLKTVSLSSSIELEEVVIEGGKREVSFEIDKKVINVADQDTETGQTAIEVMQTIPSVGVDIDGNVSLRGNSSFTLLIDGRPSAMEVSDALASIPASTIENIEIITNASAKYEAEGVSGIINIITKKKKLEGTSLLANVSVGNYDNYNGNLAVNINHKKWSYTINANLMTRNRPRELNSLRRSSTDSIETVVSSFGDDRRSGGFNSIGGGITFRPNSAHSFTLGAKYGLMAHNNSGEINFSELQNGIETRNYFNDEDAIREFGVVDLNMSYRHNIKRDSKHYLELRSVLRSRTGDEEVITQYFDNGQLTGANRYTETGPTNMVRFNLDYSKAIGKDDAFEMGSQIQFGQSGDDGKNYDLDVASNEYILNEQLSSDVRYTRDISAVYTLYRGKMKKLGYQVGFRAEQTTRNITSDNFEDFAKINRLDYFPSAHVSYELPKENQIMLSYSRRINRPRSWYFEPFLTWQTAYQLRTGNPDLQPEYIDAIELNWNKSLKKKGNISIETYYRTINNVINRVNEVFDGNILITKPFNVGESISFGIEPAVNFNVKKWWKVNLGLNFYDYTIRGTLNDIVFDQHSFNWSSRMTNTLKFGKDWTFQVSPQFNSASVTPQGTQSANWMTNLSLKKSFKDKKYTLGLQARDAFSTSINEREYEVGNVFLYTLREPRTPFITVSFSLKLNNYQRKMERGGPVDDF